MRKFERWERKRGILTHSLPWFPVRHLWLHTCQRQRIADLALAPESIKLGHSKERKTTTEWTGSVKRVEQCWGLFEERGEITLERQIPDVGFGELQFLVGCQEDPQSQGAWGGFLQPLLLPKEGFLRLIRSCASCLRSEATRGHESQAAGSRRAEVMPQS